MDIKCLDTNPIFIGFIRFLEKYKSYKACKYGIFLLCRRTFYVLLFLMFFDYYKY